MTELNKVVSLKDIRISIDENIIFDNFNMELNAGEFVYLVGKEGCGKSTLLKSLYADLSIDLGMATVLNFDVKRIREKDLYKLRRQMGIVFQDFQLLPDKTAYQNLDIVLRAITNLSSNERKRRIEEVLKEVDLANKGYKYPHELSGGEQQRVAIARAIIANAKLILADEPTANLNEENALAITKLLQTLSKEHGTAVLMATHNRIVIENLPARIIEL